MATLTYSVMHEQEDAMVTSNFCSKSFHLLSLHRHIGTKLSIFGHFAAAK